MGGWEESCQVVGHGNDLCDPDGVEWMILLLSTCSGAVPWSYVHGDYGGTCLRSTPKLRLTHDEIAQICFFCFSPRAFTEITKETNNTSALILLCSALLSRSTACVSFTFSPLVF